MENIKRVIYLSSMSILLFLMTVLSFLLIGKMTNKPVCKYNNACTQYHQQQTGAALQRVVKLMLSEQDNSIQINIELNNIIINRRSVSPI